MYKSNGDVRQKAQQENKRPRPLTAILFANPQTRTARLDDIVKDMPEVIAKSRRDPLGRADQLLSQLLKFLVNLRTGLGVASRLLLAHHCLRIAREVFAGVIKSQTFFTEKRV